MDLELIGIYVVLVSTLLALAVTIHTIMPNEKAEAILFQTQTGEPPVVEEFELLMMDVLGVEDSEEIYPIEIELEDCGCKYVLAERLMYKREDVQCPHGHYFIKTEMLYDATGPSSN